MRKRSRLRATVRPALADIRAVSAVEFALVAPILLSMIGGLLSFSTYLRAKTTIHSHAREAARGVALGYMTVTEAKRFAEGNAGRDLHVNAVAVIDPATAGNPADPDVIVTVEISAAEMNRISPFTYIISQKISTTAVMRSIYQ